MYFYSYKDKILISNFPESRFNSVSEEAAKQEKGVIYVLNPMEPSKARRSFLVTDPTLLFLESENIDILREPVASKLNLPDWLTKKINCGKVLSVNTSYPFWEKVLDYDKIDRWRINIAGLGDVGGILSVGLRLSGDNSISDIGVFDLNQNKIDRWVFELNQILPPDNKPLPPVHDIDEKNLFDCDMFVFCVSLGVPPVGDDVKDVRLAQFQGNAKIINSYAKRARESNYKGIFAVISDPVDLLCKSAFISSNTNNNGEMDFKGLAPEQIRGYGLGVMNARAAYYASFNPQTRNYMNEGRVFGPHGDGLIVANSISKYDNETSIELTKRTIEANMEVRKTGFKPYIAPAISSGSLSLIATINGNWHYSSTFIGGVFMGARNRLTSLGTELERLNLTDDLFFRIKQTYEQLGTKL